MQRQARSGLPRWPHGHRRVAYFLPHVAVTLRAAKPKDYAECPLTLAEHIKRGRRRAGLTQTQAAPRLDVCPFTVLNWEKGKTEPPIAAMPAIIAFLGDDPGPFAATLAERMRHYRRLGGLSIKEAAMRAGVHEDTWGLGSGRAWCRGRGTGHSSMPP